MQVLSLASRMRTAISTVTNWSPLLKTLHEATLAFGNLAEVGSGWWSPDFWRTKPIVVHISEASKAAFPLKAHASAARAALAALAEAAGLGRVK
eukprot:1331515-Pyramimonas_sp.AAC.1